MVQKLRNANVPVKQVSKRTGISDRTIGRMVQEPAVTDADDATFHQSREVGQRSTLGNVIDVWIPV